MINLRRGENPMSRSMRILGRNLILAILLVHNAAATDFSFTKIADTETPVPGGSGTFSLFADARALDGDVAVFYAFDALSRAGIYLFRDGLLDVLVDESTRIPGSQDTFTSFFGVSMENGIVTFTAGGPAQIPSDSRPGPRLRDLLPTEGILACAVPGDELRAGDCGYAEFEGLFLVRLDDDRLITIANSSEAPFNCVSGVDFNELRALFTGGREPVDLFHNHSEAVGGATGPGQLLMVISPDMEVPEGGGRTFVGIDENLVLSGNGYAFAEIIENTFGAVAGIYKFLGDGQGLRVVADSNTPVPGGTGTFMNFAGMDFDAGYAAFMGRDSGNAGGVYTETAGGLRVVMDRSTQVPGESFNFLGASNPIAHWQGSTAFSGYWSGGRGLCIEVDGVLEKVIESGDILDGRVVDSAYTGVQQLNDRWMLVKVNYENFSGTGLFLVEMIP
jgi:hypothetical protein